MPSKPMTFGLVTDKKKVRKANTRKLYRVDVTESGDVLEEFSTYRDALRFLERNEAEDRREGNYTPGFYTISRFNGRYYEGVYDSKYGEKGYRPQRSSGRRY